MISVKKTLLVRFFVETEVECWRLRNKDFHRNKSFDKENY